MADKDKKDASETTEKAPHNNNNDSRTELEKEVARATKITCEFDVRKAYNAPVRYKAGNKREQVLIRVPKSSTFNTFKTSICTSRWLDHVMEQVADSDKVEKQQAYEWVLAEMKKRCPEAFDAVAQRGGYSKDSNKDGTAPKLPKIFRKFPDVQHTIVGHAKTKMNESGLVSRVEMVRYFNQELIPSLLKKWNEDNDKDMTHVDFLSKVIGITKGRTNITQNTIRCVCRINILSE